MSVSSRTIESHPEFLELLRQQQQRQKSIDELNAECSDSVKLIEDQRAQMQKLSWAQSRLQEDLLQTEKHCSDCQSDYGSRNTALNAGAPARRDAYRVVLLDDHISTAIANEFTRSPDRLLADLVQYQARGGTNFTLAIQHAQSLMETPWSTERTPVVISLSNGQCTIGDETTRAISRRAIALGKPHAVSFGPARSSDSLRRMVQVASEVQNNAPRDPLVPVAVTIASSYSKALDTVRLAETFLDGAVLADDGVFRLRATLPKLVLLAFLIALTISVGRVTLMRWTLPPSPTTEWFCRDARKSSDLPPIVTPDTTSEGESSSDEDAYFLHLRGDLRPTIMEGRQRRDTPALCGYRHLPSSRPRTAASRMRMKGSAQKDFVFSLGEFSTLSPPSQTSSSAEVQFTSSVRRTMPRTTRCVVARSRIIKTFTVAALHVVIKIIPANALLEIVNFNVEPTETFTVEKVKETLGDITEQCFARAQEHIKLERGYATKPLPGMNVPFRSCYLWAGILPFRAYLSKKINVSQLNPDMVIGKSIPNIIVIRYQGLRRNHIRPDVLTSFRIILFAGVRNRVPARIQANSSLERCTR
uniref:VWFA domain-containing protein n=1 Tax=Mycena chlorophos TaxID=658473 RepID=A0ABQ0L3X4_MYCCL|nr:predicted protein [Mycena chlorophos]